MAQLYPHESSLHTKSGSTLKIKEKYYKLRPPFKNKYLEAALNGDLE